MKCKICANDTAPFAKATILTKYNIQYFRCPHCQFIQTESPYWFDEAYNNPINNSDIGLVGRNILLSHLSQAIILSFFDHNAKFLDYGGGYGLFVRLQRDAGFNFYRMDKFCANLFAQGFEAETSRYELATAFELFEHFVEPIDEIAKILEYSTNIFFSTELVPPHIPLPQQWWYYGLDHGQHVSLYSPQSLAIIAQKFGLSVYSNHKTFHLLTPKKISPFLFNLVLRYKIATVLRYLLRKRFNKTSLIPLDYFKVTGKPWV